MAGLLRSENAVAAPHPAVAVSFKHVDAGAPLPNEQVTDGPHVITKHGLDR